jgi:DNA end-binding protein Ku
VPRPVWTGSIAFGLVSVPVKLYTAVRDRSVRFNQIEEGTGARIRYRRVSDRTGEEVPREDIVRGYEVGDGHYVTITDEDLEAAAPEATRSIDIEDFVELARVDPVYFDTTYYLGPADQTADRAYALLYEAMRQSGRAAIGRFVLRSKERMVALRPVDGVLALETMHFHDEVVPAASIEPPDTANVGERELTIAHQLIESLATDWEPERYTDTYRERVLEIVERKSRGEEVIAAAPEEEPAGVIDLVAALRASVERTRDGRDTKTPGAAVDTPTNGDDLSTMTRQQLYQLAQEQRIRGRSDMTKEELAAALRDRRMPHSA